MLKVWGRTNSINVQKVMWAIGELGLGHERIDAGGSFGGLDAAEFRARNPNALVPTLDDEGLCLWESNAIVRYLARRYGQPPFSPAEERTWAAGDIWMDWQQTALAGPIRVAFWTLIRTPEAERDMDAVSRAAAELGELFGRLDRHLAERAFVAGDSFTAGDIPVGVTAWRWYALDIERPHLAHVEAWFARLKERPAYRQHVMLPLS